MTLVPPTRTRSTRAPPIAEPSGAAAGYDPSFLGVDVPLPERSGSDVPLVTLAYTHFSVILDRDRRLAALTAVNIDGAALEEIERSDEWRLDERVAAGEQTGPEVYARNDLDRGHLVRRRDPVWGFDAARANSDTFFYTNAAPQVSDFNQSDRLWLGVEDYVLGNARATGRRLTVFTAPVFGDDDIPYRGTRIPSRFVKVAVWVADDALACTAYLLDQGELLDALLLPKAVAPELGAFRTFQVSVSDVAELTGFDLEPLIRADRYRADRDRTERGIRPDRWTPLTRYEDIRL